MVEANAMLNTVAQELYIPEDKVLIPFLENKRSFPRHKVTKAQSFVEAS